jgi:DNA-3-methyladenine glycosylase
VAERFPDFLEQPVDEVARRLLGCSLIRTLGAQRLVVRIVETEAYDEDDPASHAFGGETRRNAAMFGPSGRLYVYFTYGMHHCCNVVAEQDGHGAGVLIRAAEPLVGVETIEARRGVSGVGASNGPAKLCQALSVDLSLGGHDLRRSPMQLAVGGLTEGETVAASERIGISKAKDRLRRYTIAGNPWLSRR